MAWQAALGAATSASTTPTGVAHGAIQGMLGREFSKKMYKKRFQYMVTDLRRAGLNPVLAVGANPGVAQAGQAPGFSPGSGLGVKDMVDAAKADSEIAKAKSEASAAASRASILKATAAPSPAIARIVGDLATWVTRAWTSGKDVADKAMKLAPILDTPPATGKDVKEGPGGPRHQGAYHTPGESGSSGGDYHRRE